MFKTSTSFSRRNSFAPTTNSAIRFVRISMFFQTVSPNASKFLSVFGSLTYTPKNIFLRSYNFKVFGVAASFNPAQMVNMLSGGYRTLQLFISHAMGQFSLSTHTNLSVPVSKKMAGPNPASPGLLYTSPKSRPKSNIVFSCIHGGAITPATGGVN